MSLRRGIEHVLYNGANFHMTKAIKRRRKPAQGGKQSHPHLAVWASCHARQAEAQARGAFACVEGM